MGDWRKQRQQIFVLLVTMFREAVDDFKRYLRDRWVSSQPPSPLPPLSQKTPPLQSFHHNHFATPQHISPHHLTPLHTTPHHVRPHHTNSLHTTPHYTTPHREFNTQKYKRLTRQGVVQISSQSIKVGHLIIIEKVGGVVWCGVVWWGVAWCGVVWCGVVWRGVAGCSVAWCGVLFYNLYASISIMSSINQFK